MNHIARWGGRSRWKYALFLTGVALVGTWYGVAMLTRNEASREGRDGRQATVRQAWVVGVPVADVRAEPNPGSELVTQALLGTEVVPREEMAGAKAREVAWVRVAIPAQGWYEGFIRVDDLKTVDVAQAGAARGVGSWPQVWVVALKAEIKERPAKGAAVVGLAYAGTKLPLVGAEGPFLGVRLPSGIVGWIAGADAKAVLSPPTVPNVEEAIATAVKFMGTPYFWGGMTCEGIDCSGLTYTAFSLIGVSLPRDADIQHDRGPGVLVARESLRRGDLVFFSSNGRYATHVGIYLGDSKFINSASRSGVAVDDFRDPYWANVYFGARRPIP